MSQILLYNGRKWEKMPGLNQLKQFYTDILSLGNEFEIRAGRGEKASLIPIPPTVEDKDDSDEFKFGLPVISEEEQAQAEALAAEKEKQSKDFSDIIGSNQDEVSPIEVAGPAMPDMSDLLSPGGDIDLGDIDLSDFEEPKEEEPKESEEQKEVPIEDLDLDALLKPKDAPEEKKPEKSTSFEQDFLESLKITPQKEELLTPEPEEDSASIDAQLPPELQQAINSQQNTDIPDLPDFDDDMFGAEPESANSDFGFGQLDSQGNENNSKTDEQVTPDFNDSVETNDFSTDKNETSSVNNDDFGFGDGFDSDSGTSSNDFGTADLNSPGGINLNTGLSDDLNEGFDFTEAQSQEAENQQNDSTPDFNPSDFGAADFGGNSGIGSDADFGGNSGIGEQEDQSNPFDQTNDLFNSDDPFAAGPSDSFGASAEPFDTSAMDGMDFSNSDDSDSGNDFELGFDEGDDMFNIPGFSDTTSANFDKKAKYAKVDTPDFEGAISGNGSGKPKNTFTEEEYAKFKNNLLEYPLNLRIAVEDLVVKNEFTDDAVFVILNKVLSKVPARQLASELEKMLDIQIDVPKDFERRTASEYEEYKKSVEYQIKNKIIPGAIITAFSAIMIFCIFVLSNTFIYKPLKASYLYKQGYKLLQHNEYPQSEEKFDQALSYKPMKKWFFRYAEGYRDHKQYDRARMMYRALLQRFNHNLKAGLDWAQMESQEIYNYQEAERILKREVLDFHGDNEQGILALGDNYLDWAYEIDDSKYEDARSQYEYLVHNGKEKNINLFLSRMMRYYIRTDSLKDVLAYKEHFMSLPKTLKAQDLIELSGYLLEKRYGELKPSEEELRHKIEDVRNLLERALKADPQNAIALYNMGHYFIETENNSSAKKMLQLAIDSFREQTTRSKRDTYKYINSFRMLGERYAESRAYILAEETYVNGIQLFEAKNRESNFESTPQIGELYSNLGDLNYYISGDMKTALQNFTDAIENKYDTASIRYKVGYIQYTNKNYAEALGSFILSSDSKGDDTHLLLALANTLSCRGDNYAAQGYYEKLLDILNKQKDMHDVLLPQVRSDQGDIVDTYMKASNNLGVTLHRIAQATGNSNFNGEAIVQLSNSLRAWDALTRNPDTMVRLYSSNLAEQNIKYITHPVSSYEPEIYTEIHHMLSGEKGLE